MFGISKLEIFVICLFAISWLVGWICLIADAIASLIECKNCSRRKNCEFIIFSENCPKRYCMSEEERKQL